MSRRGRLLFGLFVAGAACTLGVLAACGPANGGGVGPGDAALEAAQEAGDVDDGGSDAEAVTEGGDNVDLDGGEDPDADAAALCNTVAARLALPVVSTCASTIPVLGGGPLVGGTYDVTSVTDLASKAFCASGFVPATFQERMVLTVSGASATAKVGAHIESDAGSVTRHTTTDFTPTSTNTSPMQGQEICPLEGLVGNVRYQSGVIAGKQSIEAILPYGKGAALYVFERQ